MSGIWERLPFVKTLDFGKNSKTLFKGLLAIGPAFVLARALTALTQVLAGRWLGPKEFGIATIILAAAGILTIPLQIGFPPAVIKFSAMEAGKEGQSRIISTAIWGNLFWAGFAALVLYTARRFWGRCLHIDANFYLWGLGYAAALACYTIATSCLHGIMRFFQRGLIELAYGAATLLLFIVFFRATTHSFMAFIGGMIVALILSSAISFYDLRSWIKPRINPAAAASLSAYLLPPVLGTCAEAALAAASPLILAAYLSPREVGIFAAYDLGTIAVASALTQILRTVLAPFASRPSHQPGIWKKFFLLCPPLLLLSWVTFVLTAVLMIRLVGKSYPLDMSLIYLFAAAATMSLVFYSAGSLLGFSDVGGVWLSSGGSIVSALLCIAASLCLIPSGGLRGAAWALIASYIGGFSWCALWGWRKIKN